MPFTFSHPALVLPFSKKWFSLTALVAGSVAPDFEYFFRLKAHSEFGHDWDGLLWFDLPLAILLMWVYNKWIKNKLIDHLPTFFNKRLSPLKNSGRRFFKHHWVMIIISALIGSASHIILDSFTHLDGFFAKLVPIMSKWVEIGGYFFPIVFFLQVVSSAIGIIVILIAIGRMPVGQRTNMDKSVPRYWTKVLTISLLVLIARFPTGFKMAEFFGDVIDTAVAGGLLGLLIVTLTTKSAKKPANFGSGHFAAPPTPSDAGGNPHISA